jgi:MFS transporter, CP family, cyanate transporter
MTGTEHQSARPAAGGAWKDAGRGQGTGLWVAGLALFVAAVNLRPAIAAVSPLVDTIRAGLGLSAAGVALLTTLPTLAMGLCAPLAAMAGRRWGIHRSVLIGLAVVAVATAARFGGQNTWLQMLSAAAAGAGIAIAQTLLPAIVRIRFPARPAFVTGVYTAGLGLGAVVAAGASVPIARALGSWPAALGSWALLAVIGMIVWQAARRPLDLGGAAAPGGPVTRGLPWRDPQAWRITAVSAGNSALYYCELAWIAPLLQNDGHRSQASAADLLTVMLVIQVFCMLTVPALLGESRDRRIGLAATAAATAAGFACLAAAPATAGGTWAGIVLIGVGHGGLFPLVLAVPVSASRDADHARRLSGMAFFVGYACAAAAPLLVGWLRDASGNFHLAFALLAAAALAITWPIVRLSPARLAAMQASDPSLRCPRAPRGSAAFGGTRTLEFKSVSHAW